MSVHSAILEGRHRKRLLFTLLLISLTGLFFFSLAKQRRSSSLLTSDTEISDDEAIDGADAPSTEEKDYTGGWLEPEWEWARDVSIVYTWYTFSTSRSARRED